MENKRYWTKKRCNGLKMELQRVKNDKFRKIKEIDDALDEESIITTVIT